MDAQIPQSGFVVWITGMNGSGKSTLAAYLAKRLTAAGRPIELIDTDDPENPLTKGLGASREDRDTAVRRVGYTVKMVARAGGAAIVASLSPYREPREQLRREIRRFVEVFVDAKMEVLQKRDPIYRVDAPYEPPTHPDVMVKTDEEPVEVAAKRIFQTLVDVKYLATADFMRLTGGEKPKRARPAAARAGARRKLAAKAAVRKAPKKVAARARNKRR